MNWCEDNKILYINNFLNLFPSLAIMCTKEETITMTAPKPFIGRPSQYDLKQIARDLVEWAQQSDALKFTMFAAPRHINLQRFPEWAAKDDDFAEAYALAKQYLDTNRFKAAATEVMPEQWYSKNERIYDPVHDHHYRQEKKFESDLRKEEEGTKQSTYNIIVSNDLASGTEISTKTVSEEDNPRSQ